MLLCFTDDKFSCFMNWSTADLESPQVVYSFCGQKPYWGGRKVMLVPRSGANVTVLRTPQELGHLKRKQHWQWPFSAPSLPLSFPHAPSFTFLSFLKYPSNTCHSPGAGGQTWTHTHRIPVLKGLHSQEMRFTDRHLTRYLSRILLTTLQTGITISILPTRKYYLGHGLKHILILQDGWVNKLVNKQMNEQRQQRCKWLTQDHSAPGDIALVWLPGWPFRPGGDSVADSGNEGR